MNDLQKRFFVHLADIQKECVEICIAEYGITDEKIKNMLYDITYENTTKILETLDGYSSFSSDGYDIINTVTQEKLKENPNIELHDKVEEYLKCKL